MKQTNLLCGLSTDSGNTYKCIRFVYLCRMLMSFSLCFLVSSFVWVEFSVFFLFSFATRRFVYFRTMWIFGHIQHLHAAFFSFLNVKRQRVKNTDSVQGWWLSPSIFLWSSNGTIDVTDVTIQSNSTLCRDLVISDHKILILANMPLT